MWPVFMSACSHSAESRGFVEVRQQQLNEATGQRGWWETATPVVCWCLYLLPCFGPCHCLTLISLKRFGEKLWEACGGVFFFCLIRTFVWTLCLQYIERGEVNMERRGFKETVFSWIELDRNMYKGFMKKWKDNIRLLLCKSLDYFIENISRIILIWQTTFNRPVW